MFSLITDIAAAVLSNVVQLIAGCLLSIPIYMFFRGKPKETGSFSGFLPMVLFSLLGILLPLGTYGVIPLSISFLAVGFRLYAVVPLIASNLLFNMLVPFNDPSFIWKTGIRLVILAFAAGLIAGLILKALKCNEKSLLRIANPPIQIAKPFNLKSAILHIDGGIKELGIFLLAGVVIDTVFHIYALGSVINVIYSNPLTSSLPGFFAGYDVSNPFFLLTFKIIYMLMNFVKLSGLAALFKPKGLVMYLVYYFIMAVILAVPAFIK